MASDKGHILVVLGALLAGGAGVAAKTCGKTVRHLDEAASLGARHIDDSARIGSKADEIRFASPRALDEGAVGGSKGVPPGTNVRESVTEELVFQGGEQILDATLEDQDEGPNQEPSSQESAQANTSGRATVESGQILSVVGLLLFVLFAHNLAYTLWLFFCALTLRVRPLEIRVGLGPRLFVKRFSGTEVSVYAIPIGTSAVFHDDERVSEHPPGMVVRAVLTVFPALISVLFSLALLGPGALSSFVDGFAQVPHLFWPNGDGVELIERFAELLSAQGIGLSLGVLFAKFSAASVLLALIQPFLWFGVRKAYPGWTIVLGLLPTLVSIGVLVNLVWAAL